LSKVVGTSVSHVTYHVKVLAKCGAIALTDTQRRRGAVEHYYASTVAGNELVAKLLEDTRVEDGE
jgi:DNA-binding transcriptional ArsR family regulator